MPFDSLPSVGAMLRAGRERQGLSVNDVAERTRIRSTLVREIESDNFFGCGDTFFARGHVRSIALTVGVDPGVALAEFDAAHGPSVRDRMTEWLPIYNPGKSKASSRTSSRRQAAAVEASGPPFSYTGAPPAGVRTRKVSRAKSAPSWKSAMLAAVVVVAILAVASFLIGYAQGPRAPFAAEPIPTFSPSISPEPAPTPSPTVAPAGGLPVRIEATTGSTWMRVTNSSGRELFQGVLNPGDAKEFTDPRQLTVRFGDSTVVDVVVNGVDKGAPPCGAAVCSQTYKLDQGSG
ncbi:MAG: RodZ domain-containing protein [Mycobacteriales bacterium]